jgi:hypothetical protein
MAALRGRHVAHQASDRLPAWCGVQVCRSSVPAPGPAAAGIYSSKVKAGTACGCGRCPASSCLGRGPTASARNSTGATCASLAALTGRQAGSWPACLHTPATTAQHGCKQPPAQPARSVLPPPCRHAVYVADDLRVEQPLVAGVCAELAPLHAHGRGGEAQRGAYAQQQALGQAALGAAEARQGREEHHLACRGGRRCQFGGQG